MCMCTWAYIWGKKGIHGFARCVVSESVSIKVSGLGVYESWGDCPCSFWVF